VDIQDRERLLTDLAEGRVTLRDFAELKKRDVEAIAHLGRVAYESKKFDQAASIFVFLEQLEADRPDWVLFQAQAYAAGGKKEPALAAIDRYIEGEIRPPDDVVRALILRAQLVADTDKNSAAQTLAVAKLVASRSAEAQKVLKEAGL
jgi:hypothetical protein